MITNRTLIFFIIGFAVLNIVNAVDIYPNYIAGTVYAEQNVPAPYGTQITVIVTSGEHKGYTKTFTTDSELIPPIFYNNGYYDTGDDSYFSTGDTFAVIVDNGSYYGSAAGVFYSYGNGELNSSEVNIYLNKYKKIVPSTDDGSGGDEGGGKSGYDSTYNYTVPEPPKVNISTLFEPNAPPFDKAETLPPEAIAKYIKLFQRSFARDDNSYQILAALLLLFAVYTTIFIIYKKMRKEGSKVGR
jgi:hypothetical protein